MISNLMWLVTGASLVGVVLNIRKKQLCFVIWLVTNSLWCWYNYYIGAYAQSFLYLTYTGLSLWGIWSWRKNG